MRFKVVLILLVFFVCCREETKPKIDISGNWYVGWFNKKSIDSLIIFGDYSNFNYEEIYVTKDKIITVNNITGECFISDYEIKNDSFYSSREGLDLKFRGFIKNFNEAGFIFTNDIDSISYHHLKENNGLSNLVDNDFRNLDIDSAFYQNFLNRSYELYEKLKADMDKQLNN